MGGKEIRKEKEITLLIDTNWQDKKQQEQMKTYLWKYMFCLSRRKGFFYSEDGQTLKKVPCWALCLVQYICNCWYGWRWLKGLRCTNSQYPHDQEPSLSEYESPRSGLCSKDLTISISNITWKIPTTNAVFVWEGKPAYRVWPDGAEMPILRSLFMVWRIVFQEDFFYAPQKLCVTCGTGQGKESA